MQYQPKYHPWLEKKAAENSVAISLAELAYFLSNILPVENLFAGETDSKSIANFEH